MEHSEKQTQYETELLETIQKQNWMRWAHIDWTLLSFSRATAYNHNLDKLDTIKSAFEQNRSRGVNYLLQKWMNSDNATLQIAAFKIVSESDDHKRLNQAYVEQQQTTVDLSNLTTAEIKELLKSNE
jgi:hypothetical protein